MDKKKEQEIKSYFKRLFFEILDGYLFEIDDETNRMAIAKNFEDKAKSVGFSVVATPITEAFRFKGIHYKYEEEFEDKIIIKI